MELDINFDEMVEIQDIGENLLTQAIPEEKIQTGEEDKEKVSEEETIDINKILEEGFTQEKNEEEVIEDKVKEVKETTKTPAPKNNETSSNVQFTLIFKSLAEQGILSVFDEENFKKEYEEDPATALLNATEAHLKEVENTRLAELDEDFKEYSALKDLGINTEEAKELVGNKIAFESLKIEDIEKEDNSELRKKILVQNFKNSSNFSDAKIEKLVSGIVDKGEDIEEAKEALEDIKKFNITKIEETKKLKELEAKEREDKNKEAVKKYTEFVEKLEEPMKGVKIDKGSKEKLKDFVLKGQAYELRKQDPVKFDTLISYFILNGGLDQTFDKQLKTGKTESFKQLQNTLKTNSDNTKGLKPSTRVEGENIEQEEFEITENILKQATNKRQF